MGPRKQHTLEDLVRDAKAERGPAVDWDAVEGKLFPRVEREAALQAKLSAHAGSRGPWVAVGIVLAAAAAIPLFFARTSDRALDAAQAVAPSSAGSLVSKDRNVVVHVTRGGASTAHELGVGDGIAAGDSIDARAGRAVFGRPDPGGVAWTLEDSSQVDVRAAQGTLILALNKGAVEAQVTPVPSGEAFAIDVEGTRVAVHGTHFRVERLGTRAIVDLREGVVSIGDAPKSGSTYGDLITAPAHAELDTNDPHGTLKVTHDVNRVRAAQSLAVAAPAKPADQATLVPPILPAKPALVAPSAIVPAASAPSRAPAAPPTSAAANSPPAPVAPSTPVAPSAPAAPVLPAVDPNAQRTILDKVRSCARARMGGTEGVVVTVSTRMDLQIGDDGMVVRSSFDPPLAPDVQACVSGTLSATRFAQPGAVTVSIDVTQ